MPSYTLRNIKTKAEKDVICSWAALQKMLKADDNLIQKLALPKIISETGSLLAKTDNGWKDNLSRIKAGSGKNNTIKT